MGIGRRAGTLLTTGALALAVAAPGAAASEPAPPAPRGIGIRLLDGGTNDPRRQSYIVERLGAGSRLVRHVEVSNTTGEPQDLSIYVAGADVHDGSFTPGLRGEPSALGSWSQVGPTAVHLRDGGVARAEVSIAVPRATDDGEYYGAVLAERTGHGTGQVRINSRVGVRIYLSVGTGIAPITDFRVDALSAGRDSDGSPLVSAVVTNNGERAVDLVGDLRLADGPGGITGGPFTAQVPTTLAPGDRQPVRIRLAPDLPRGPWLATVTLRSGSIVHTAEGRVLFPPDDGLSTTAATVVVRQLDREPSERGVAVPVAGLALLGASGALVLAVRGRTLRSGRR